MGKRTLYNLKLDGYSFNFLGCLDLILQSGGGGVENTPPPSAVPGAKRPVLLGLMRNKKVTIALILEI